MKKRIFAGLLSFAATMAVLSLVVFAPGKATAGEGWGTGKDAGQSSAPDTDPRLGVLEVTDGGTVNNRSTFESFGLQGNELVTIQCPDAGAWIITDKRIAVVGRDILIGAGDIFPTSLNGVYPNVLGFDGGRFTTGLIAITPVQGSAAVKCNVYARKGNE